MSTTKEFQEKIHEFLKKHIHKEIDDVSIFERSLTHKSFLNDHWIDKNLCDYDSLEFLGDTIINWIISNNLFDISSTSENMTKIKHQIIQSKSLVITAKKIKLDDLIRTGKSLKHETTDSIIEDVFEAFCAAIYLTFGFDVVKEFIQDTLWNSFLNKEFDKIIDYKTLLQEFVHKKYKTSVKYLHTKTNEQFTVTCIVLPEMQTTHSGTKLKDIEQQCAKQLLLNFFI